MLKSKLKKSFILWPMLLIVPACFFSNDPVSPEAASVLTLKFARPAVSEAPGQFAENSTQLSQLLSAVDSVVVKVFYAGSGRSLEAVRGVPVPQGSDTVTVSLSVSAEQHKRVAVELYEAGLLIYFGVNEDVEVRAGRRTAVTIDAFTFSLGGLEVNGSYLTAGDGFTVYWPRVPSATAYHIQESPSPDFTVISYEVALTDTAVTFTRAPGPYFYRVAPLNSYTFGSYCPSRLVYVYGAPFIDSINPAAAARGETITIRGGSLDYPGNELYIGGQPCQVSSAGPMVVQAMVPQTAVTDTVYVTGSLGSGQTAGPYQVQLVAFVAGADLTMAQQYQILIQARSPHAAFIQNTGVKIVTLSELDTADMSVYAVIIIGPGTGDNSTWGEGIDERATEIRNSQAQVIGLGEGGNAYFRAVNLYIGRQGVDRDMGQNVTVEDPADLIYNWPAPLNPGQDLQLYIIDVPRLAVQMELAVLPVNIGLYASREFSPEMFLLLNETVDLTSTSPNNFYWGFDGGPANMTADGHDCFLNVLANLFNASGKVVVPLSPAP